jgi:uroporphyrinogen-III synthase
MVKYSVLSTKKLKPSQVQLAERHGVTILEEEFITILPIHSNKKLKEVLPFLEARHPQHIAFTSANAVEAVKWYIRQAGISRLPGWKLYTLAGKTMETLLTIVLPEDVVAVAGNAATLAEKIISQGIKELVFFCGNQRREELPLLLEKSGVKLIEVIVYETIEKAVSVNFQPDGVLFFSPSGVRSFFSVNQLKSTAICFAVGETTAASIKELVNNQVVVCKNPDQESMIEAVVESFKA